MNYTTLAKVRAALGAETVTDDTLLQVKITEASRAIDRLCSAPDNYFMAESVTGELCNGLIAADGVIIAFLKKAIVNSVSSFEYRKSPKDAWIKVDADALVILNKHQVAIYGEAVHQGKCFTRVSYNGGYGTEAGTPSVITGLSEDIINAATVLTVRFYKEEKTGLTDAIGVAELGTMQYTKAMPTRVVEMMNPYKRII
ncbi:MAG: hypothetical protein NTW69_06305 [Chloroflexi bacterium]|nr:hypothetical protein [Chloroflexota bacterium]